MSFTTFGTWGRGGGEGDTKYLFLTFDLFTLSINIHLNNTVISCVFLPFLADNYESCLIMAYFI